MRIRIITTYSGIITSLGIFLIVLILNVSVTKSEDTASYDINRLPSEDDIFQHITTIVKQGIRRPGYPSDIWVEDYVVEQFKKYGLEDVHKEKVTHHGKDWGEEPEVNLKWTPLKTALTIYNEKESIIIPAFSIPYAVSTGDTGVDLEIVVLESQKSNPTAKGKIALYPLKFREGISHRFYKRLSEWDYDPQNTFLFKRQTPCFSVDYQGTMDYAIDSGALGYIGILETEDYDMYEYYVPLDGKIRPIPGVYVSRNSGEQIKRLMRQGQTKAKLVSKVSLEPFVSHNIVGRLKGNSDDWIIIGSHHDAPFYGAAQDAAGTSLALAQVEYWSKVPSDKRPHNMLFLLNSGHICGATGSWTFVNEHKDFLKKAVLEIHLEEIGMEYEGKDGKFVPTGYGQPWWWFTSQNSKLVKLVQNAIIAEDIERSYIFRPNAFSEKGPVTDGAPFYRQGVPVVNLISAPVYIFSPTDTLEKVNKEALVPITKAVIRIINGLDGISAEQMRNEILKDSSLQNVSESSRDKDSLTQGRIREQIRERIRQRFQNRQD